MNLSLAFASTKFDNNEWSLAYQGIKGLSDTYVGGGIEFPWIFVDCSSIEWDQVNNILIEHLDLPGRFGQFGSKAKTMMHVHNC